MVAPPADVVAVVVAGAAAVLFGMRGDQLQVLLDLLQQLDDLYWPVHSSGPSSSLWQCWNRLLLLLHVQVLYEHSWRRHRPYAFVWARTHFPSSLVVSIFNIGMFVSHIINFWITARFGFVSVNVYMSTTTEKKFTDGK